MKNVLLTILENFQLTLLEVSIFVTCLVTKQFEWSLFVGITTVIIFIFQFYDHKTQCTKQAQQSFKDINNFNERQ